MSLKEEALLWMNGSLLEKRLRQALVIDVMCCSLQCSGFYVQRKCLFLHYLFPLSLQRSFSGVFLVPQHPQEVVLG